MAGNNDIYVSEARGPRADIPVSGLVTVPQVAFSGGAAQAAAGTAIADFGEKFYQASQETEAALATTDYIKKEAAIRQKWIDSNDYVNAPREYAREHAEIEQEQLGRISNAKLRAQTSGVFARRFVEGQKEVQGSATKAMVDVNGAALKERIDDGTQRAARAGSPVERDSILGDVNNDIDRQANAGIISAVGAYGLKKTVGQQLARADLARDMSVDPAGALKKIDDPAAYPSIDPSEREAYKAAAQNAYDEREKLRAGELAMRDPAMAAARVGRLTNAGMADDIFNRVIIAKESSGDPAAIGRDENGKELAYGLSQLRLGTARAQADRMGVDLGGVSDADLRRRLLDGKDPLNRQLGAGYWQFLVGRYQGNAFAASGAYFAGEGDMDRWHKEAVQKFGDHYSPAQLAAIVGDGNPKTQRYILDAATRMGIDPGAPAPSFRGSYAVAGAVDAELASQQAQAKKNLTALVALQADDRDALITAFKKDYFTDPQKIAAIEGPLIALANTGDAAAAVKLRELKQLKELAPMVHDAYQARPEELAAATAALEAKAVKGGASAFELQKLDVLKAVAGEVESARKSNPVALIERREGPDSVVNVPGITDPAFGDAMVRRSLQAERANQIYGGDLKVLKPEEAEAAKASFGDMQPAEKLAVIQSAAAAMPERPFRALIGQVAGNDSLAATAGILGRRDPALARDILAGQALLGQEGIKPKVADVRTALQGKLPSNVYPADVQADMIEASLAVYAAERGRTNTLFDASDRAGIERAVERVAGKMVKINGAYAPVPAGVPEWQLRDGVRSLDAKTIDAYGGAIGNDGKAIDPAFLASHARLKPLAPGGGSYAVYIAGPGDREDPVMTRSLTPFTIDMAGLELARRAGVRDTGDFLKGYPGLKVTDKPRANP